MKTIDIYNTEAQTFKAQYLSTSSDEVHSCWLKHLPKSGQALDIGAGVGRDALWLANKGFNVVAVEPAKELLKIGQDYTQDTSVYWLDDLLPELKNTIALQTKFDLILVSAVWMHIPSSQRERAYRKLTNLLKPNGKLVISLRHGKSPDKREMYPVTIDELSTFSAKFGLSQIGQCADKDKLKRPEVLWETIVHQLPDDGSGAFPLIRNILMNDVKSSTYKLALIRVLLRIADGHPGSVLRREDNQVILPLGLISLLWAKQYKPLIDNNIQQNSVPSKGLGFIKEDGWLALSYRSSQDFSIGNLFLGDDAKALHNTLKEIGIVIKKSPVGHITLPGTKEQVFEVMTSTPQLKDNALFTDLNTLSEYGEFSVPEKIWDLMTQYACWIEPVAINEWVNVMKDYKNNLEIDQQTFYSCLKWIDPERTTTLVRKKVFQVQKKHIVECLWSKKTLVKKFDIDHCLPFSRWPNNDLWNLFPTSSIVNNQKRDQVPSHQRFNNAKESILNWWEEAWVNDTNYQKRFYAETTLSLPGLNTQEPSLEDVFEALKLQSIRVTEMQQLKVWH